MLANCVAATQVADGALADRERGIKASNCIGFIRGLLNGFIDAADIAASKGIKIDSYACPPVLLSRMLREPLSVSPGNIRKGWKSLATLP